MRCGLVASPVMFQLSQLRVFTEPQQGATYDDLLGLATAAERLGFGAFFRSDHYLAMGPALERVGCRVRRTRGSPWPDSPATRRGSASARSSRRRRSATWPTAVSVAEVDQMSGGRVELGLGAGWYERSTRRTASRSRASVGASTAWRSSWP